MAIAHALQIGVEEAINNYTNYMFGWIKDLQPFAIAGVTLYFIFMGLAMAHGTVRDSMNTLLWRIFKIAIIGAIAFGSIDFYKNYVQEGMRGVEKTAIQLFVDTNNDLQKDVIDAPGVGRLGKLIDNNIKFVEHLARYFYGKSTEPDIPDIPLLLAGLMCSLCQIVIVCAALIPFLVAKVALTILLTVSPFFIMLAIWPATQRFTEAWLSASLTATFTTAVVIAIVGILPAYSSAYIGAAFGITVSGNTLSDPKSTTDMLSKTAELVIVTVVSAWIIWKVVSLVVSIVSAGRFGQVINTLAHTVVTHIGKKEVSRTTHHLVSPQNQTNNTNVHLAHQQVFKQIHHH